VKSVFVSFEGVDQFDTEGVASYEAAIKVAAESGANVRAILLCNPHNPLGRCYSAEALIQYMTLCEKYKIHLILDEVYATSVYGNETFTSILAIDSKKHINPNYLHMLYGFSKDLAGGGLRLGCIWTRNTALISALSGIVFFAWPSNLSDAIGAAMLEDEDWMASFREMSKKRVGECAAFARSILDDYGIRYAQATAGFYLWLDVRPFLSDDTKSVTWSQEHELLRVMKDKMVNLTPGEILSSEFPGFLRLCFVKGAPEVLEGLRRLKSALDQMQAEKSAKGLSSLSI
jgi:1-aminocyclopropane-1-carboxylate synthase